jgi:hypothetical protein
MLRDMTASPILQRTTAYGSRHPTRWNPRSSHFANLLILAALLSPVTPCRAQKACDPSNVLVAVGTQNGMFANPAALAASDFIAKVAGKPVPVSGIRPAPSAAIMLVLEISGSSTFLPASSPASN